MKYLLIALCIMLSISYADAKTKPRIKRQPVAAFTTESYLVADSSGNILSEHDSNLVRPIASITKLMIGLLVSEQNLDEQLLIPRSRTVQSRIPRKQISMTRRELLTLALVKSDNFAAQILCINLPNCVDSMNQKSQDLGMNYTHFDEPTGLSKNNVSTASDLLKLITAASHNITITELSSMPRAEISVGNKLLKINNTNPLTNKLDVILSKTGFTNPAGGCLVMVVNSPIGQRFLVLLGSRNTKTRGPAMEKLYKETTKPVDFAANNSIM